MFKFERFTRKSQEEIESILSQIETLESERMGIIESGGDVERSANITLEIKKLKSMLSEDKKPKNIFVPPPDKIPSEKQATESTEEEKQNKASA